MPIFNHGLKPHIENIKELPEQQKYTVLSLFSGCGGLDLGFIGGFKYLNREFPKLPFNILEAHDINQKAIETYHLNISDNAFITDLTEYDTRRLPKSNILIGGFPCQDFSSSGNKKGLSGSKGQLYKVMSSYMQEHQPDIVIAENVPHLARLANGEYLRIILAEFESCGYNFDVWELYAPDYGLSQSRRRLFFFGVRKDIGFPPNPPEPTHIHNHIPIEIAIGDLENVTDESVTNQSQYFVATRATAGGGQGDHTNQRGKVAYCIRANAKARIQFHYSLDRRLTVRECARLQSFPDEFVFPFSAMINMEQIGNAVPPILAYRIAEKTKSFLNELKNGKISSSKSKLASIPTQLVLF